MKRLTWMYALVIAGCSGQATRPTSIPALGIASVEVDVMGPHLTIAGLDAAKQEVGRVDVTVGAFVMSDEFAEDRVGAARNVVGRQIDFRFGATLHHESQGLDELILPLPPSYVYDSLYEFVVDPNVAPVLEGWGVTMAPRHVALTSGPVGEQAYNNMAYAQCGGTCDGGSPCPATDYGAAHNCPQLWGSLGTNTCSSHGTGSYDCAVTGASVYGSYSDVTWEQQCCSTNGAYDTAAEKACVPTANGSTPCGTGGSVGCAVCWSDSKVATGECSIGSNYTGCSPDNEIVIRYCDDTRGDCM